MTPAGPDALFDPPVPALPAGAHHLPGWLTAQQQRWLVARVREWSAGPIPMRAPRIRGHQMSVKMVCLGWHWQPYRYSRTADDVNGLPVLGLPDWLVRLGRRAVVEAGEDLGASDPYTPDTALINYYDVTARMGMHQDRDERSDAPVVSLSIGDSCRFRFGNTENRGRPYQDLELSSGDLFVFGGPSRFAYHGVPKIYPGTAPADCGVTGGRINITLRTTGLSGESPA